MTSSTETILEDSLELVEFDWLKNRTPSEVLSSELVREFGIVYVAAIKREGCSGCETQKPLFSTLATKMTRENSGKVRFRRIYTDYCDEDKSESWDGKRTPGHAAYPRYMIHVKSHVGPLGVYGSIHPSTDELEKQIRETLELAEFYNNRSRSLTDSV